MRDKVAAANSLACLTTGMLGNIIKTKEMKGFYMKMKYSTIFLVALLVQSCSNEKIENDWTRHNIKGNVKSYSEFFIKQ